MRRREPLAKSGAVTRGGVDDPPRPDVFRLNIAVSRQTYESLFDTGLEHDFTAPPHRPRQPQSSRLRSPPHRSVRGLRKSVRQSEACPLPLRYPGANSALATKVDQNTACVR